MKGEGFVATALSVAKVFLLLFAAIVVVGFVWRNSGAAHAVMVDWVILEPSQVSAAKLILLSLAAGAVGWSTLWHVAKFLWTRRARRKLEAAESRS